MDLIDKNIIFELLTNYRASYQAIAKKLDLSVNAVKKRFEKLKSVGIIRGGLLTPMAAMKRTEDWVTFLRMKEANTSETILDVIGSHRLVNSGSILTDGSVLCYGYSGGAQDLQEIGTFFRQIEGVKSIEFHTILTIPGKESDLTTSDLKVLQYLRQYPRSPISEIAKKIGISSRRVKKTIEELIGENGSEPPNFINWESRGGKSPNEVSFRVSVWWNLNAGGYTAFIAQVRHEEGVEARGRIIDLLKHQYPFEFWYAYASAFEPVFFCVFMVKHLRESIEIVNRIKQLPGAASIYPIFGYPTKVYRSQIDDYFERLFKELAYP